MNVLYSKEKRGNVKKLKICRIKKNVIHWTLIIMKESNDDMYFLPRKTQESFSSFTQSSSNQDSLASGDGDCARCCRLCGGDTMLKYFRDSYVWEGVEERYDQLLYDCFGVKVTSSDCMICDWCVRALRGTEKFRALVHAAFDPTASASDMAIDTDASSTLITIRTNSCQTTNIGSEQRSRLEKQEQQMISKKVDTQKKRTVKKMAGRQDIMNKRTIVNCEVCNQKYPMMVPNGVCKAFTCSRCNKNRDLKNAVCKKCNIVMPKNMYKDHMEMHVKADVRATSRLMQHKKLLHSSRTKIVMVPKPRNQCTKDPKKYCTVGRQVEHDVKEDFVDNEKYASNYDEDFNSKQHEESQMYPASHHCRERHYILENEIK